MSIFNANGEHLTTITVRSGADCEANEVKVEAGSTELGSIFEIEGDDSTLRYRAFLPNGDRMTRRLHATTFTGALAWIVTNADLT